MPIRAVSISLCYAYAKPILFSRNFAHPVSRHYELRQREKRGNKSWEDGNAERKGIPNIETIRTLYREESQEIKNGGNHISLHRNATQMKD